MLFAIIYALHTAALPSVHLLGVCRTTCSEDACAALEITSRGATVSIFAYDVCDRHLEDPCCRLERRLRLLDA